MDEPMTHDEFMRDIEKTIAYVQKVLDECDQDDLICDCSDAVERECTT